MRTKDTVALWGCIASASAWSAAATATQSGLCAGIATAWLVFAALIYLSGKKGSGDAAEKQDATNRA